jgi:hypothetical protein
MVTKKIATNIQLPKDCIDKMDAIKEQWGSSHNFQIEMSLRAFWKEDLKLIPKRFKCPKCKADIEVK